MEVAKPSEGVETTCSFAIGDDELCSAEDLVAVEVTGEDDDGAEAEAADEDGAAEEALADPEGEADAPGPTQLLPTKPAGVVGLELAYEPP